MSFEKKYYMWLSECKKELTKQNQRHKKLFLVTVLINELQ